MFAYNLDHVAIAVRDLDEALGEYKRLYGSEPLYRELVPAQGVEEAMVAVGGSFIQLLQPLSPDSPVGRFLSRRGEGLHHVALAVADIDSALEHLRSEGADLVDDEPVVLQMEKDDLVDGLQDVISKLEDILVPRDIK